MRWYPFFWGETNFHTSLGLSKYGRFFYPCWGEATIHLCVWGQKKTLSCWAFSLTKHFQTYSMESGGCLGVPSSQPLCASREKNPATLWTVLGRLGAEVRMLSRLGKRVYASKALCDGEDGNISLGSSRWLFQEDVLGTCSGFAFHVVCVHAGSWLRLNKG